MNSVEKIYIRKMRYADAKSVFLAEIERLFFRGCQYVEVIHGIGTYTLRNMLIHEIDHIDYISIIESRNPGSLLLELHVPDKSILKRYT